MASADDPRGLAGGSECLVVAAGHLTRFTHHEPSAGAASGDRSAVAAREALRIIDGDGVQALTMRRLASAAGVSTMAVYNHVDNKDELLRLAAGHVVGGMPTPAVGADWVVVLRGFFTELHDRFLRHPGVAQLYGRDTFLSETVYEISEPVFDALLRAASTPTTLCRCSWGARG